ncbi:MAG: hypothetical protein JKY53_11455 [Flavobacteriales bacterium]|nr:hypothetical protein [Flavobacteriales bacterium]
MMKRLIAPIFFCMLVLFSCTKDQLETELPPEPVDTTSVVDTTAAADTCKFTDHIKPIIDLNCAFSGCHDGSNAPGDFSSYSEIKSRVDNGFFETKVLSSSKDMPPSGALSQADRDLIQCWLDNGAVDN